MAQAITAGTTFVMAVDSDDFVSRRLAGFVNRNPTTAGWYSSQGYFYVSGHRTVIPVERDFHQRNGSTHILAARCLPVGEDVTPKMSREEVLSSVGADLIRNVLGAHRPAVAYLAARGWELEPLPFPGALWVIGGENYTRVLHAAGRRVALDKALADEFGIGVPGPLRHLFSLVAVTGRRFARRVSRLVAAAKEGQK